VGPRTAGPRTVGPRTAGPRTAGPRTAGPRSAGPWRAGPREAGARWNGREQSVSREQAIREQYLSGLVQGDTPRAVDRMFKIVYICRAPVLGKSVPKAFPKHGLGKFLPKKYSFGSESDPNHKIWERLIWNRARWETLSRPNPEFWDLGFGTDFWAAVEMPLVSSGIRSSQQT
jgi:hypothetical protein